MGLFSILKSAPSITTTTVPAQDTWIELGCTEQEFRDHFKGHEIKVDNAKASEDFTLDEDIRENARKREILFPLTLNVLPVHLWKHPGMIIAQFTTDNILGSCEWYEMSWDVKSNVGVIDVPITMDTVSQIVDEMNSKYGKTPKETNGSSYFWPWTKDNINYSLRVVWYGEGDENNSIGLKEEYMIAEE